MTEKLKYYPRPQICTILTLRKLFDEFKTSKGPYIWYQSLGFSLYIPKTLANFLKSENQNFRCNASDSHISKVEPFLENDRIMCKRFLLSSLNLSEDKLHKYFKKQMPILVQCYLSLKKSVRLSKYRTIDTHYCPAQDLYYNIHVHVPPL